MGQSCVQASQQFKCGQNVQNTVDLRANCLYSPLSAASDNMNLSPVQVAGMVSVLNSDKSGNPVNIFSSCTGVFFPLS